MNVRKIPASVLFTLLLFICLTSIVAAQEFTALQGRVFDQNGALIVGATVVLDNGETHKYRATTDNDGQYKFTSVAPGKYDLIVAAPGFVEWNQSIELAGSPSNQQDITLAITIREQLEVSAARDSLTLSTIRGRQIEALPDDSRQLMRRLQRIAKASGMADEATVYVNGFREVGRLPPKQDIQSVTINSDPFAAEFSDGEKARVEITTKPDSKNFHGEVGFTFNGQWLNARDPFALTRAPVQLKDYSAVFSGPFKRNRWSYFVDLGHSEADETSTVDATVLDLLTLSPAQFAVSVIAPARETDLAFRSAYALSKKHQLDFKYSYADSVKRNEGLEEGFDLPERGATLRSTVNHFRISLTSFFNDRWLNEARVELGRNRSASTALTNSPAVIVFDSFSAGGNQDFLDARTVKRDLSFTDNVTHIAGRHVLKFGSLTEATRVTDIDRSNFGGTFLFGTDFERNNRGLPLPGPIITPLESYRRTLLGLIGYRPQEFTINVGDPSVGLTQWETGLFLQDEWRVDPRLTFSYGLRSEFQTHLRDKLNLAPRGALALRPFKKSETTLRIGAGLFYSWVDPDVTIDAARFDGSREEELVIQRPAFFSTIPPVINRAISLSTLHPKSPDLRVPYIFSARTSYEQKLGNGFSVTFNYGWTDGVNLLRTRNVNAPLPGSANMLPIPTLGPVLQTESTGRSKRHQFGVNVQADLNEKISFNASYRLTFARSDTDSQSSAPANSYDLRTEFGRSGNDQRHRFYFEAYAELPWGIRLSPSLSVESGRPFNITTGADDNGDTLFTDRPAFANAGDPGAITTRFGVFNPHPQSGDKIIPRNFGHGPGEALLDLNVSKAFEFGGSSNGSANGDETQKRRWNRFRNHEYGLTFGVDIYNLLNHTNLGEFVGVISSPLFGRANSAEKSRRINFEVRFTF